MRSIKEMSSTISPKSRLESKAEKVLVTRQLSRNINRNDLHISDGAALDSMYSYNYHFNPYSKRCPHIPIISALYSGQPF